MTRQATVSQMKGRQSNDLTDEGKPQQGTETRRLYDALRRGEKLHGMTNNQNRLLCNLRVYYGIETVRKHGRNGYTMLKGEWDGPYLVPLERILQDEAS